MCIPRVVYDRLPPSHLAGAGHVGPNKTRIDKTHTFAPCFPLRFALPQFVSVQHMGGTGGFVRLLNSA